jgi:hypothetical protein
MTAATRHWRARCFPGVQSRPAAATGGSCAVRTDRRARGAQRRDDPRNRERRSPRRGADAAPSRRASACARRGHQAIAVHRLRRLDRRSGFHQRVHAWRAHRHPRGVRAQAARRHAQQAGFRRYQYPRHVGASGGSGRVRGGSIHLHQHDERVRRRADAGRGRARGLGDRGSSRQFRGTSMA